MKIGATVALFSRNSYISQTLKADTADLRQHKDIKRCLKTEPDVLVITDHDFRDEWRSIFMSLRKKSSDPVVVLVYERVEDFDIHYFMSRGVRAFMRPENSLSEVLGKVEAHGSYIPEELAMRVTEYHNLLIPHFKRLTHRQYDVACALIEGKTYKTIAAEHNSSIETIRDHVKNIYRHFEINSKTELMQIKSHFPGVVVS